MNVLNELFASAVDCIMHMFIHMYVLSSMHFIYVLCSWGLIQPGWIDGVASSLPSKGWGCDKNTNNDISYSRNGCWRDSHKCLWTIDALPKT